jgi:hypothetical protein
MKRIILTRAEIEALLCAAFSGGEGHACFETADGMDEKAADAYESGMEKLRAMLARRSTAETVSEVTK